MTFREWIDQRTADEDRKDKEARKGRSGKGRESKRTESSSCAIRTSIFRITTILVYTVSTDEASRFFYDNFGKFKATFIIFGR